MTMYEGISFSEPNFPGDLGSPRQSRDFYVALQVVTGQLLNEDDNEFVVKYGELGLREFALRTGIGVGDRAEEMQDEVEYLREQMNTYCNKVPAFTTAVLMLDEAIEGYSS